MASQNFYGPVGVREICNHNLRFRIASKSNICLICHCNKIDDILTTESCEKRKLSTADIHEIVHQFRVLNSILDVPINPIEPNLKETLLSPVLMILKKLLENVETLSRMDDDEDSLGLCVCTILKKLLYSHSIDVKNAALSLLSHMVVAYKHYNDDSCVDKTLLFDLPTAISQVELIYFVTEAMNTSSENLFRMAVQVLEHINQIDLFRNGRMIPVLESALRISTMRIPDNIHDMKTYELLNNFLLNIMSSLPNIPIGIAHQLIYLFWRLPHDWTDAQFLPWIKLLIFCGRVSELKESLWNVFVCFVKRTKDMGTRYSVTSLKCVLLTAYAMVECEPIVQESEDTQINATSDNHFDVDLAWRIFLLLMDVDLLPALLVLLQTGTLEDAPFVVILLNLFKIYPEQYLKLESEKSEEKLKHCNVECDTPVSTDDDQELFFTQPNNIYEVWINENSVAKMDDGFWCWTPKVFMQIIGIIRLNSTLMINRRLFELWNEVLSRILVYCCGRYLPQLHTALASAVGVNESDFLLEETLISTLSQLDTDATTWTNLLDIGTDCGAQKLDVVLSFYFLYALFVGKDIIQFLNSSFPKCLAAFLQDCVDKYKRTQKPPAAQGSEWTHISFYFRIGLMITSVLPRNSKDVISLCDKFEVFSLDVQEFKSNFKYDVMVYHWDVFILLFRERFFTAYEQLVEIWLNRDKDVCIAFFTYTSIDDVLNSEISKCLLTMAALGNREISKLAVPLSCKRLKKFKVGFEFSVFMAYMDDLIKQILSEKNSEKSRNSLNLLRFSNVIQVAVQDKFLFSPENTFPLDFFCRVAMIILKFHNLPWIGKKTIKLLSSICRNELSIKELSLHIDYREFVRYLGKKVHKIDFEDPEEMLHAQKLLTLLIRQTVKASSDDTAVGTLDAEPLITWKLGSVLSYIQDLPHKEVLSFIITLFRVDFKCELIQIEELSNPTVFAATLLNLFLHLQAVLHYVTSKPITDLMWEIFYEIACLASGERKIKMPSTFQNDVLFQPWTKVLFVNLLEQCHHAPSKLTLKPLEFLHKWTSMILDNKLEDSTTRVALMDKMIFGPYIPIFQAIHNDMRNDRTQRSGKENQTDNSAPSLKRFRSSSIFDIERKTKLIAQISKTCQIFLSSFN